MNTSFEESRASRPGSSIGVNVRHRGASALVGAMSLMLGSAAVAQTTTATPTPAATPPPAPAPAAKPETPLVKFYGFIKPAFVYSSGVESFGQNNSNAVTAAAHPVAYPDASKPALSAQVMQTRLGLIAGGDLPVQGKVEIDFLDVTRATPTTQINPRLRLAFLEYKATDTIKVGLGQNWDLFSPLNPNTYNLPAALLGGGGNSGFQRHQLWSIMMVGKMELGLALGMPGINTAASAWAGFRNGASSNAANNLRNTPTVALRAGWKDESLYAGVSFIGALLKYWDTTPNPADGSLDDPKRQPSIMANVFAQYLIGKGNVRFEGYIGQNGQNLGLFTLAAGSYDNNIAEMGGFVSASMPTGPVTPHLSLGAAKILNVDKIGIGYTAATGARGAYNAGMEYNIFLDGGVKYALSAIGLYLDGYFIATRHKLLAADRKSDDNPNGKKSRALAGGVELGMLYAF